MTENKPASNRFIPASSIRRDIDNAGGLDRWFTQTDEKAPGCGLALDYLVVLGERAGDERLIEVLQAQAAKIMRFRFPEVDETAREEGIEQTLYCYTTHAEWRASFVRFVFNGLAEGYTNCASRFFIEKADLCVRNHIRKRKTAQGQDRLVSLDEALHPDSDRPRMEKLPAPEPSVLDALIRAQSEGLVRERFRAVASACFGELSLSQQEILTLSSFGMSRESMAAFLGMTVGRVDVLRNQARTRFIDLLKKKPGNPEPERYVAGTRP